MLEKEKNYAFRKKLLKVHKDFLRDSSEIPQEDEFTFEDGMIVSIPPDADRVIMTAARDFQDYLWTSMGVSVRLSAKEAGEISLRIAASGLQQADCKMGFMIDIKASVGVYGHDSRGIAQALYYLEDVMTLRKAPYLKKGEIRKQPLFSPRMVHSGYGLDQYPDQHLSAIAHAGMDAIVLFVTGVNRTTNGFCDFNDLIYRAEGYGIDVYMYSYLAGEMHPEEEGAREYYDKLYGSIFDHCPGFKGVILVGESFEFPSRDPHVGPTHLQRKGEDLPSLRVSPGWWPCEDAPQFVNQIKDTVRKRNPDADIVFWTYNWGWVDEKYRLKLIDSLPTDITLMATFEMFHTYQKDGVTETCVDYTLSFEGPGEYFQSEAEAAKRRGIRLYAMANTAGLTWDIGVIPYEPMPYQWIKRYQALRKAHDRWGLCGLMESHHYGFYPSFISQLTKWAYFAPQEPLDERLEQIVKAQFSQTHGTEVLKALKLWSEAIAFYVPTNDDQYGPFRIGPGYPLCLQSEQVPPSVPYAHFGTRIFNCMYHPAADGRTSIPSIRIPHEIKMLQKMKEKMRLGLELLRQIPQPNGELLALINLGEFIHNCTVTVIHVKQFYLWKTKLCVTEDEMEAKNLLDAMEKLAREEIRNTENTIPLAEVDSRLGWEPSMEYMADPEHLKWKIRQVEYMLEKELKEYFRGSLKFNLT